MRPEFDEYSNMSSYNRELEVGFSPLVDIGNPFSMRVEVVRRQADDLDAPLLKIRGTARDLR